MNRRTFLGAAAAALSLPASGEAAADAPDVEVTEDAEYEAGAADVKRTTGASAILELPEAFDEDAEVSAKGYWGWGEDPHVEVSANTDLAALTLALSPEDARAFAADLRLAATHAEQGDARLGDEAEE